MMSPVALAQTSGEALPKIALGQIANIPGNWQRAGSLTTGPDQPNLKIQSGSNLLVGTPGQPLMLVSPAGDFAIQMEVLMTAGADAQLTLSDGYSVSLNDSKTSKAPGLWQTVELRYRAPVGNRPAMLEKLALNGVTLQEGLVLPRNSRAVGPVALAVQSGSAAIRNLGYRALTNKEVARWVGPIKYTIYEGEIFSRDELARRKVLKEDTTAMLSYEVAYGLPGNRYVVLYTGKLNVAENETYQLDLQAGGVAGLWIDGKPLIPTSDERQYLGSSKTVRVPLTAGTHDVQVMFTRSWPRPGLGLFVSKADTRPQPLHTLTSLPEPDPVGAITVQAAAKPELIRSFVQLPGEKMKRTHSLSVGTPAGVHYTVDLNQMALIQAWKGDFADVTEMWYERGEPQLLEPIGTTVYLPGQLPLMVLNNEQAAWPDSLGDNVLKYQGLTIDKQGMPTMEYSLAGLTVTDAIRPEGGALTRTLNLTGSATAPVYCRIAAGSSVEDLGKGVYAINDRTYYVRLDPKAKPRVRQSGGKQELLLPVAMKNGAGSVQYSILF
ncbi:hypothetical protein GCM10023187_42190 [Nibrella viscosa]|uniref:PA14 domain-containing protein n=2 Tax=Nibrella viscosa TaxID=1084524 RepID=A0ABP8KQT2_9BACT